MTMIPPTRGGLVRRDGREAAGVVAHNETCLVSDHPVCGVQEASPKFS